MIEKLRGETIYVRIRLNRYQIRHVEGRHEIEISPLETFSHGRMLIADFEKAQKALNEGIRKVFGKKLLAPTIIMHPLEKLEGGLTPVEHRVLHDLGAGAGARKVIVWLGDELDDKAAISQSNKA